MSKKQKVNVKCPQCGGTKFHLENPNLHLRDLTAVYRAKDRSISAEWGPERVEQDEKFLLWCCDCADGFFVRGWDEEEVIEELLDEMETAGMQP